MTRLTPYTAVNEPDRVVGYTVETDAGEWIGAVWMVPAGYLHSGQAEGAGPCLTLPVAVQEIREAFES